MLCFNRLNIKGKNNIVVAVKAGKLLKLGRKDVKKFGKIRICGNNNRIYIYDPINPSNVKITILSDNNVINIGQNCNLNDTNILMERGNDNQLHIGDNTYISKIHFYISAGAKCSIGQDCLISQDVQVWASDFHALLNNDTKEVINKPKDILTIGNHCWIGANVVFTKHAKVADNTVVANAAVVSKVFTETNTVIAGNPAMVVKRNIDWDKKMEI